jgi:hypothetical protein
VGLAILDSLADFEAEIPRLHGSERSSDVLVVPARQAATRRTAVSREGMTCGDGCGAKTSPIPVAQMDAETYGYP